MSKKKVRAAEVRPKKEPVPAPAAPEAAVSLPEQNGGLPMREIAWVVAYGVLLLAAMLVQTGMMSLILACIALVSAVCKWGRKAIVASVPLLGFFWYAVVYGAAGIWSPFEAWAVKEYFKFMAAFMLAVILLTRFEKKHVPALLWVYPSVSAITGFLSVDMDASGFLFWPVQRFVALFDVDFKHLQGVTQGRLTTIYNNANVVACMTGCAALLALYLLRQGKTWKTKLPAAFLLGVNSMVFFMCYSRGGMLCFAIACLVWLIVAGKGKRIELFIRMLICVGVTVALALPSMQVLSLGSALPDITTLLCGFVIFGVDFLVTERLSGVLNRHMKAALAALGVFVAVCVVGVVAVLSVTGPVTLTEGGFSRTKTLKAGTYEVICEGDALEQVRVQWHKRIGGYMTPWEVLYEGDGEDVSFTMPEDGIVSVSVRGAAGTELRRLALSDGTEFKLDYKFLPASIEGRMQDSLLTGESFSLRMQYDIDAVKIWLTSPIVGRGIASTEELYSTVQPFHYESKYAHNQILQVMCDTGLLGLVGYVAFMGGLLWVLLRAVRKQKDELAAVFVVLWVLINVHSLMEINFNLRVFQCFTYTLLMLPTILFAQPLFAGEFKTTERKNRTAGTVLLVGLTLYVAVFGTLVALHRWADKDAETFETTSYESFLDRMNLYVKLDVYSREETITEFLPVVLANDRTGRYVNYVQQYVQKLERMGTYSSLTTAADQYYLPVGRFDDVFRCTMKGLEHEASTKDAWDLEFGYFRDTVLPTMGPENLDYFIGKMMEMIAQFDGVNDRLLDGIELEEDNAAFVELLREAASGSSEAYAQLLALAQAE